MRRFFRDRRGNVAMIFALALLPIVLLVGGSVDLSRMRVERAKLQMAVDAAVLATTQLPGNSSEAEIEASIESFMAANFDGVGALRRPLGYTRNGTQVSVDAVSDVPMIFAAFFGMETRPVGASAEARRGGVNMEVALVLDVTGSMAGSRITDLKAAAVQLVDIIVKDVQTPYYTRMAIAPYSNAVNVGTRANALRGAPPAGRAITNITWRTGSSFTIQSIPRASQTLVRTTADHGFKTGDTVAIYEAAGMTRVNGGPYRVEANDSRSFYLKDTSGAHVRSNQSGWSNYTANSGKVAKCAQTDCRMTVTSANHGFSNGDVVVLNNLASPMTALNRTPGTVANRTANSFTFQGPAPSGIYASGGQAFCTNEGCQWYYFNEPGGWGGAGAAHAYEITDCVSERIGANRYTDAAPASGALLGRVYGPASGYDCPAATVRTLTDNRTTLKNAINGLSTRGATAGHIGIGWGWYLVSPRFNTALANIAAADDTPDVMKVAVLMTDGEFNAAYCNGVLSSESTTTGSQRINCAATNGTSFTQARNLCAQMKTAGVRVYTVGFGLNAGSQAAQVMNACASDPDFAYLADNGAELNAAFQAIGNSIDQLRLSR